MSFALTPTSPFADTITPILASWLNFVRAALPDCGDMVGGGSYELLPGHVWTMASGGGSIVFNAPFAMTDGDIPLGGHLDVEGIISINSGAYIQANNGGTFYVRSNGLLDVKSNGTGTFETGSFLNMLGSMTVSDFGTGGANGKVNIGSVFGAGHVIVTQYGDIIVQSSGALNMNNGAVGAWGTAVITDTGSVWLKNAGAWTWTGTSVLQIFGTSSIAIGAAGKILFNLGGAIQETVALTGTQPAKNADPGVDNALCGTNVCKAWANIRTDGAGGITLQDGYNIDSVALSGINLVVNFARSMSTTSPHYSVQISSSASHIPMNVAAASATSVTLGAWDTHSDAFFDWSSNAAVISTYVAIFGRQ